MTDIAVGRRQEGEAGDLSPPVAFLPRQEAVSFLLHERGMASLARPAFGQRKGDLDAAPHYYSNPNLNPDRTHQAYQYPNPDLAEAGHIKHTNTPTLTWLRVVGGGASGWTRQVSLCVEAQ